MADTDTIEVLKAARELISDPERWTQGKYARNKYGSGVPPESDSAVCFCSAGALQKVSGAYIEPYKSAFLALNAEAGDLFDFNDEHTHPEVLFLFDTAIARLSA